VRNWGSLSGWHASCSRESSGAGVGFSGVELRVCWLGGGLMGDWTPPRDRTPRKAADCSKAQQPCGFMQHLHRTRDQSGSPRAHGIHDTPKTSLTTDPRVQIDWKEVLRRVSGWFRAPTAANALDDSGNGTQHRRRDLELSATRMAQAAAGAGARAQALIIYSLT
jgi:hypothetical protein